MKGFGVVLAGLVAAAELGITFAISSPPDISPLAPSQKARSTHTPSNEFPVLPVFPTLTVLARRNDDDDDDPGPPSAYAEAQQDHLVGGFRKIPTSPSARRRFRIAHGTMMALSFTVLFPLGAIAMHVTHHVWIHAAVQTLSYLNAIGGLGLGVWLGRNVRFLDYAHTVIGMAVLAALVVQVGLGVGAHWRYVAGRKREGGVEMVEGGMRRRGWVTVGFWHRWVGRGLVGLGMVNGGLGLKLAQNTTGGKIAYSVVAGVSGTAYLALIIFTAFKKRRGSEEKVVMTEGQMEMVNETMMTNGAQTMS